MSFICNFERNLARFPAHIQAVIEPSLRKYCAQFDQSSLQFPACPKFIPALIKVWSCSSFVANQCLRKPQMFNDLVVSGDLFIAKDQSYFSYKLASYTATNETELMATLRQFRNREMVRIAWRDLSGEAELAQTLHELSWLAETCIRHALDFLYKQACERYGTPLLNNATPQQLLVLGMGKLGGWELNFSSDIDLIFAYAEEGVLADKKLTTYGEFFINLARKLVRVIEQNTADGFVFRVDTRLRPFGDSGLLVMNFDGMENYYITQACEWERYAMIKARQIAGDVKAGAQLFALLNPFIYRRYLDYGAFEELRSLKLKIAAGLKSWDQQNNIKLGAGGIREIEFIGQAFQLIRGGREPSLQQREIIKVLNALAQLKLLSEEEVNKLQYSYRFLRQVENHLQQYQDQQTHDLPANTAQQQILALAMNYDNWQSFIIDLNALRLQVRQIFTQVFSLSSDNLAADKAVFSLWNNLQDKPICISKLKQLGFQRTEHIWQYISSFKSCAAIRCLPHKGSGALDKLLPQLLEQAGKANNSDSTLMRILSLLEKIVGRSAYISLLAENPNALTQLIKLSAASPWICEYLGKYPILLDELLDARTLYEPLSKIGLSVQLKLQLQAIDMSDIERMMILLREFKQVNFFKVAVADIMQVIPLTIVSDNLTFIAEVLLQYIVQWRWQLLVAKHGYPPATDVDVAHFGVIGMGKLGGIELGYGSDLDMVFIHDYANGKAMTTGEKPISCNQFYGLLGQHIMTAINTRMLAGVLYEVDLRLRPNGNSGLLVCQHKTYWNYLRDRAWTWEHQALVRGRFVAGDQRIKPKFEQTRKQILCLVRNQEHLKAEVCAMRKKMRKSQSTIKAPLFHLKHSVGGIVDIEFIVQFVVLANAAQNQQLVIFTNTSRILAALQNFGLIGQHDALILKQAYCAYRDSSNRQILQGGSLVIQNQDFAQMSTQVATIWHKIISNRRSNYDDG